MAYFDSIKIGGTIKQVQVVQELNALPSPVLETSPQLVKIGNDLYMRESKMGGAYGTYRFMIVPTTNQVHNVEFVSNGQTFGEIIINSYGEMTYNNTLVYSNGNWVNENYKTIAIFGGNFTNALDTFLRNNAEKIIDGYFKYIKVSSDGGAGTTIIDITDLDEIPTQYQDAELLKTAILFDVDHLLRLTWIDDMYYYGNTDDFQYRYLSVDTNDFVIMRYDLQDIAKAPKIVNLNDFVPKTATQGNLPTNALTVLQQSNENYIVFNDEIYRLADKQHNAGYLVYSHNGHDTTGCFFQKCITITLSSRAWVLEEQENQAKLTAGENVSIVNNVISAEAPITIVDALPEANEENFEKGKIYTQGELLQYISKIALTEPNLQQVASLPTAAYGIAAAAVGTDIYLFGGTGSSYLNTINKFSKTTNQITTLSITLPETLCDIAAAAVGTDIYLFGGRNASSNSYKKTIYKFSTTTLQITTLSATLPAARTQAAAAAVGTDIYIFGGSSGTSYHNTIYKFSTTTLQITTLSTQLPAALQQHSAAAVGTDIYIFGGYASSSSGKNTIYKFSTTNNQITTLSTTIPTAAYGIAAAAVGTDIYLFGGFKGPSSYNNLNTINKFSTTTLQITTLSTTIPTAAYGIAAAAVGTDIYLFGGFLGQSPFYINTINKAEFGFTYQYKTITAE